MNSRSYEGEFIYYSLERKNQNEDSYKRVYIWASKESEIFFVKKERESLYIIFGVT